MKKFLIVCLFFVHSKASAIDFGIQGGIGQNELVGDVTSDIKEEIGYRVGFVSRYELSEDFNFKSGLLYTSRKYQVYDITGLPFNEIKYDVQLTYLDVPLLLEARVLSWLNIFIGSVVAFNLNGNAKGTDVTGPIDYEVNDITSPYFLGQAGINFDFGLVNLDFIYERGFNRVFDGSENDFTFIGMNIAFWLYESDSNDYSRDSRRSSSRTR